MRYELGAPEFETQRCDKLYGDKLQVVQPLLNFPALFLNPKVHYRERFEVFTAVTMKNAVFWNVTPCASC
jgi:hypothetical protein